MRVIRDTMIIAVLLALIAVLGDVHRLLKTTTTMVADTQQRLDYTSQDLNAVLLHTDLIMGRIERASRAQEQVSQKSLQLLNETSAVLVRTDKVLSQLQSSTADIDAQTVRTLQDLQPVMAQAQKTLADTDKQVSDPAIDQMLADMAASAQNVALMTGHINATTADIQTEVHQMTKPSSLVKQSFEWAGKLLGLVANGRLAF